MKKYPKWKINVQVQTYFTCEIEAESEREACEKAVIQVQKSPAYYKTGRATIVTGVFINDKEAREFFPYVPEALPSDKREDSTDAASM